MGTFSTMVRPRATSRSLTRSMTSSTSSTISSPWRDTAPESSPVRIRWRACWARVLTRTQKSANSSEAMNARTSRSTRPLMAAESGPTSSCRRGASVITPANTLLRIASMSTCCWIASVTRVAMTSWTSGEFTSGPDGVDVPFGVVQGPLPPVRHRRRRGQQGRQHQADRPPRPTGRGMVAAAEPFRRAGGPGTGSSARSLCGTWGVSSRPPIVGRPSPGVVTQNV